MSLDFYIVDTSRERERERDIVKLNVNALLHVL